MGGQVIDLGKLRFQMRDEWDADAEYESNDVVRYGGNLYVYTYPLKQAGNLPTNTARFTLMMSGSAHKGAYNPGTAYRIGEVVTFGALTCRAVEDIEAGVAPDTAPARWVKVSESPVYRGEWAAGTEYRKGEFVTVGASTVVVAVSHTSGVYADDLAAGKWSPFMSGIRYRGVFAPHTMYANGDIVTDGLHLHAAKAAFMSGAAFDQANWDIAVRGADYLPTQLGKAGMTLFTDGTNPYWGMTGLFENPTSLAQLQAAIQAM